MRLGSTITTALRALTRNKMRSLLTTLGVVIGVAAVIIMQSLGAGATALVQGEISSLGSNMMVLMPGGSARAPFGSALVSAPPFTRSDMEAIARECHAIRYVSPQDVKTVVAVYGENNRATTLYGVWPDLFGIRDWGVERGRLWNDEEERRGAKVCVIGKTIEAELFGQQDPVGAELRLHDLGCEVIGVMTGKGTSTFGMDQDDVIFMPHTTVTRRITGSDRIGTVILAAEAESRLDEGREQVEALMRERRHILPGEEDDFTVRDMREIQQLMGTVTGVLTSLLAGVAAISLLVGGIGIMNIMLVSVTERTREIGIRLAVGARSRDILRQFLVEAIVLASAGGLLGVTIGVLGGWVGSFALEVPFSIPLGGTVIAFAFAVVVGLVFGVFPARKAANLRPIEALRYE